MRIAVTSVVLVACMVLTGPAFAEDAKPLTNQDVVQMVKAGLPESTILLSIKNSPADFKTAPTDLIALKKAGVSQAVLDGMLTHGGGPAAASGAPQAAGAAGGYSPANGSQGGFLAIDGDRRISLDITREDAWKTKKQFWHNEYVGIFAGSRAETRLSSRTPTFELPFSPGADAEKSVRLTRMKVRGDTREASLRVLTYDTMARKVPTVTEGVIATTLTAVPGATADSAVGASLLVPVAPLEPGEYAIIRNNTDVYDFGVD